MRVSVLLIGPIGRHGMDAAAQINYLLVFDSVRDAHQVNRKLQPFQWYFNDVIRSILHSEAIFIPLGALAHDILIDHSENTPN